MDDDTYAILAEKNNVELINSFEDDLTPLRYRCKICEEENEEYPDNLLNLKCWCENCRTNPNERLKKVFDNLDVKILDTNVKDLFDYKLEFNNKKILLAIQDNDNDGLEKQKEIATKAKMKLIIIPRNVILNDDFDMLYFLESAISSVEMQIMFVDAELSKYSEPKNKNEQLTEEDLVIKLLDEAGYPRRNLFPVSSDIYSYYSKPLPVPIDGKVAYGYCRVSTKLQLDGHSIAAQVAAIKRHCEFKNLHLTSVYFDLALSGRSMARPALNHLLKEVSAGNTIVVASLSRLARNLKNGMEILDFLNNKRAILSLLDLDVNTESAMGRMIFQIMSSFAEFESNQTRERISNVMNNMAENNTLITRPPYGWKYVGKNKPLEKVETEQEMIEYIRDYRVKNPDKSVSQICKHINSLADRKLRKAARWYDSTLLRLMYANNIPVSKEDEKKYKPSASKSSSSSSKIKNDESDESNESSDEKEVVKNNKNNKQSSKTILK